MKRPVTGTVDVATIAALYPALADLPASLSEQIFPAQGPYRLPAGAELFVERQPCHGFPLLIEGRVKVVKQAASGRELLLYRLGPGASCLITSSCLLGHSPYNARGIAETDVVMAALPEPAFWRLMEEHEPFRDFVFHLFADRISELMQLVEEVAFARLDQRLAKLLIARDDDVLRISHQLLADELGSVREIVSRLLKGFEAQGLVLLGREQVTIVDREGLQKLTAV